MTKRASRAVMAWAVMAWSVTACATACTDDHKKGYEHASEHPEGHDHHAEGHGHDEPVLGITLFGERFELFAEHAPAVVGREVELLAHLTVRDGWAALNQGSVRIELVGPAPIAAAAAAPARPGIYKLAFTPTQAGKYRGRVVIEGPTSGVIEGLEVEVYADEKAAHAAAPDDDHAAGAIEFLKEQQWGVPFAVAVVEQRTMAGSIEVAAVVGTPPGGMAEVGAPVAGRVMAPPQGLPRPGDEVRKGALLALLSPAPSSPEEAARANLVVAEAQARGAAAQAALQRSERLIADQAISQRELEDARREAQVAMESVRAAKRTADMFAGISSGKGPGSWRLLSPITGTLVAVDATPGAAVAPGHLLFRVLDPSELWIRARVPEQDAARIRTDRDARFQIAGADDWKLLDVTGDDATGSIVTVGRTVDAVSRSVDLIYSLRGGDPALRVGGLVQISVPVGEEHSGIVIPRAAIVDQEGREVVYVQLDGEHFAQRAVRTGPHAGDVIGVVAGLTPGERIVTRGANLVRLADRPKGAQAHGHVH